LKEDAGDAVADAYARDARSDRGDVARGIGKRDYGRGVFGGPK
jgi:hypothetical protein